MRPGSGDGGRGGPAAGEKEGNGLRIEDYMAALERIGPEGGLWALVVGYFRDHGLSRIAYLHLPPFGAPDSQEPRLTQQGFPEEWAADYVGRRLYRVDPFALFSQQSTEPFFWRDIAHLKEITPGERDYLRALEAADLGDALGIQVFGPGGRNGYVAIELEPGAPHLTGPEIREFQWACQLAHLKYCGDLEARMPRAAALTPRERSILTWVAKGKSNSVIADLIGISPHTVDTYLRRIYAKLGVSDRVSAAVSGIGCGLIHNLE